MNYWLGYIICYIFGLYYFRNSMVHHFVLKHFVTLLAAFMSWSGCLTFFFLWLQKEYPLNKKYKNEEL